MLQSATRRRRKVADLRRSWIACGADSNCRARRTAANLATFDRVKASPEAERKAREIVEKARAGRKRVPRWMWIASLVVSVVCVGALAIGLLTSDRVPATTPHPAIKISDGEIPSGLGTGLLVGLAAGIVIGSLLAVRKR
ncbi:MAG: hypothetical protein JWO36_5697 [Myxococcales bacterium]|nr:hypothetical protein [Myxococcales bacterium]